MCAIIYVIQLHFHLILFYYFIPFHFLLLPTLSRDDDADYYGATYAENKKYNLDIIFTPHKRHAHYYESRRMDAKCRQKSAAEYPKKGLQRRLRNRRRLLYFVALLPLTHSLPPMIIFVLALCIRTHFSR